MYSKQEGRSASPYTTRHPAGTSAKDGHRLCCSSSLTNTRKVPLSSSKGLMLNSSPGHLVDTSGTCSKSIGGQRTRFAVWRKSQVLTTSHYSNELREAKWPRRGLRNRNQQGREAHGGRPLNSSSRRFAGCRSAAFSASSRRFATPATMMFAYLRVTFNGLDVTSWGAGPSSLGRAPTASGSKRRPPFDIGSASTVPDAAEAPIITWPSVGVQGAWPQPASLALHRRVDRRCLTRHRRGRAVGEVERACVTSRSTIARHRRSMWPPPRSTGPRGCVSSRCSHQSCCRLGYLAPR